MDERWLSFAATHRTGSLRVDAAFTLREPWTVLFGPSGAGKSTILRMIAGLLRPESGQVVWSGGEGEVVLTDTAGGVSVPTHRRGMRLVAQRPALFPHLTVLGNVRYASRERDVEGEVLQLCRVERLSERMPATLSGGERQRVALARALAATGGRMLLLDEPFSALDTATRHALMADLRPWLARRGMPVLQVTHDVGEVFATGARVIRLEDGRVAGEGSPAEVLGEERRWLESVLGTGGLDSTALGR